MFLDPNALSPDGTTSVSSLSFSPSGKLAAYQRGGGADWRSVEVLNAETLSVIDRIDDVKFSGIAWRNEEGFYYSRYDVKTVWNLLPKPINWRRLYFHKVGQPRAADDVVFGDGETFRYVSGHVTEDQRFLVVYASNTTAGNRIFVMDLNDPKGQLVNVLTTRPQISA